MVSSGGAGGAPVAGCLTFGTPAQVGTIEATDLNGPSGMVASRANPGVLYAMRDLDLGRPVVFALTAAGKALATYSLTGVTTNDWEDISVGAGPGAGSYIYVGDIGDDAADRAQIQIYRFSEPAVSTTQAVAATAINTWQVLRLTYPDGAHNAETLMVDPTTGDMLIITKDNAGNSGVYRATGNTPADTPTALEKVATIQIAATGRGAQVTAGDISPNGDRVLLRTYTGILLWPRAATWAATFTAAPRMLAQPTEPQSEGLTFSADGRAWLSTGEQARAIYQAAVTCP